jgi:hypothetical protein
VSNVPAGLRPATAGGGCADKNRYNLLDENFLAGSKPDFYARVTPK